MGNDEHIKEWIRHASYRELLRRWRFGPVGDPIFQGELGDLYSTEMSRKRAQIGAAGAARASKDLGWDREGRK